jgi:glycine dehydrogenase
MNEDTIGLAALEGHDEFVERHIGPDQAAIAAMLRTVGAADLDALIDEAVPDVIRTERPLDLAPARSERDTLSDLRHMATRNRVLTSMIGVGYYGTITPKVVLRNLLENPGWYTAYTPYQAEVSQGRLEALLNYQQMVCDLTGLELANASLLDEGTAAAEAMAMAKRVAKSKSSRFFVDADTHPQTIAVLETRAARLGFELTIGDPMGLGGADVFGALLSYPGSSGAVRDFRSAVEALHAQNALAVMACDLLALTQLVPPGELGADIAVGNAQRFGVPMGYGGPHAAFFATRESFRRSMPGRIIGVSVDSAGRPAYRMALQTREQHIRREKATSNICTAQVLLAVIAGFYAVYHGPEGVDRIARRVQRLTAIAADGLRKLGLAIENETYFDTLTVAAPGTAEAIIARACAAGINLRPIDGDRFALSLDETTRRSDVERLWTAVDAAGGAALSVADLDGATGDTWPEALARTSDFMSHPVFRRYRDETQMMRYLRRLQAKDVALDRSMIPLGSCTMKLNAATEMIPITWREFAHIHPFAPADQAEGYRQLTDELETMLCEVTGFDAVSLQPNAGSQGEYAGLLAIRRYQEAHGQGGRDVCLIPASAHGTNPASAVMAGLRVVVVACDDDGNVDLDDLRAKAEAHSDALSALMITYPSTHGVFETAIKDICATVHEHGGQVYFDGANLNALQGLVRPPELGADVAHLNLHKTFCIPHGGGGPGVGPIGVQAHLAPYLPGHVVVDGINPAAADGGDGVGQVSAAPWGSASILPISWAYIAMTTSPGA